MALAKIRQFITRSADLLSTQLSKFEANIEAEFLAVRAAMLIASSSVVRVSPSTPLGAKPYLPGQLLLVDTTAGNVTLVIARPRRDLAGQVLPIVKRVGAGVMTVIVAPPAAGTTQGLINGAASIAIGGIGPHYATCDGQDWWV